MRVFARLFLTLLLIAVGGAAGFLSATTFRPHIDALASQITGDVPGKETTSPRILYYRNPMGLPDTSPVPKKDSMGMDYLPVYEGDDADDGTIKLTAGKLQKTGVRSEPVELQAITVPIRAPNVVSGCAAPRMSVSTM